MLRITHTTPNRLAAHLRKLQRDGEALLDSSGFLDHVEPALWDVRVWRCLDKIADRHAFDGVMERDQQDIGPIDLLDFDRPSKTEMEIDDLLRRRITRRLGTLASVLEKVEAHAELLSKRGGKRSRT